MPDFSVTVEGKFSYTYTVNAPDQDSAETAAEEQTNKLGEEIMVTDENGNELEGADITLDIEDVVED